MSNHFTSIPRDNFDGLDNLKVLKAPYNQIALMPNISYLRALKQIIPDHNFITHVPPGTLGGLQRLESIELNANQITYIYDIPYIPRLSLLDLSGNMLSTLPDLYGQQMDTLNIIDNPLICNQSLCWLRMWSWYQIPLVTDSVLCAQPQELIGLNVMRVHPTILECYNGM